ncbi:glycoside hydrolase family 5 protein [Hypoxylon sp. EC38]|nr:glycoside hydrolase family 5 protein [Hypoxylon sp. EC38]
MSSYGVKAVCLWANGQTNGSCQKGSTIENNIPPLESLIREYDDTVLDSVDNAVAKLATKGINVTWRTMYEDSGDPYQDRYGSGYFYEQQTAFDDYDAR